VQNDEAAGVEDRLDHDQRPGDRFLNQDAVAGERAAALESIRGTRDLPAVADAHDAGAGRADR